MCLFSRLRCEEQFLVKTVCREVRLANQRGMWKSKFRGWKDHARPGPVDPTAECKDWTASGTPRVCGYDPRLRVRCHPWNAMVGVPRPCRNLEDPRAHAHAGEEAGHHQGRASSWNQPHPTDGQQKSTRPSSVTCWWMDFRLGYRPNGHWITESSLSQVITVHHTGQPIECHRPSCRRRANRSRNSWIKPAITSARTGGGHQEDGLQFQGGALCQAEAGFLAATGAPTVCTAKQV